MFDIIFPYTIYVIILIVRAMMIRLMFYISDKKYIYIHSLCISIPCTCTWIEFQHCLYRYVYVSHTPSQNILQKIFARLAMFDNFIVKSSNWYGFEFLVSYMIDCWTVLICRASLKYPSNYYLDSEWNIVHSVGLNFSLFFFQVLYNFLFIFHAHVHLQLYFWCYINYSSLASASRIILCFIKLFRSMLIWE